MKDYIKKVFAFYGCSCHYSGKTRTMYVRGRNASTFVDLLKDGLHAPFAIVADDNE